MGIKMITLAEGDGTRYPKKGDTVTMHYVASLNGMEFDNSRKRKLPFVTKIGIGAVIRGWDEGILKLSVGQRAILDISSDYAYGEKGFPPTIPPNSTLRYEIELLKIN